MQVDDGTNQGSAAQGNNLNVNYENEEIYKKFAPSDDQDYEGIFKEWVRDFHEQYLSCEVDNKRNKMVEATESKTK